MRIVNITKQKIGLVLIIALVLIGAVLFAPATFSEWGFFGKGFNGERAYDDLAFQVSLGPRPSGSAAHAETILFIQRSLERAGWKVEIQEAVEGGQAVKNIIARRGSGGGEWVILGAHYDTRLLADQDPDPAKHDDLVLGANDGASGVAVLLELARALPRDLDKNVWLVFFDAEDNGRIPGWDWALGSRAFVRLLEGKPDAVVVVDMIGDADLNIYYEKNSTRYLSEAIWTTANQLGIDAFIPEDKYSMLDDHTAFLMAGIPAADIIDFDYPYWHTTEDRLDKVSPESLRAVGETLLVWLTSDWPESLENQ